MVPDEWRRFCFRRGRLWDPSGKAFNHGHLRAYEIGLQLLSALARCGADILIYDLQKLHYDRRAYEIVRDMPNNDWRRRAKAGGYDFIIVNGEVTFESDRYVGTSPGVLLRVTEDLSSALPTAAEDQISDHNVGIAKQKTDKSREMQV